jgi:hypothetical protein
MDSGKPLEHRGGKLEETHEQLLRRILTSRQFAHADSLKRILRFLADRSADPAALPPKEYDIAVNAMGRPDSFDPRTDPIVRVSLGSVRERLQSYFGTEGRQEKIWMEIPLGQYRLVFSEAPRESRPAKRSANALARFWRPYFSGNAANIIVYTEPLFFRDDQGRYFRDWNINSLPGGQDEIPNRFTGVTADEVRPVFHYLSAGEMHCLLSMTRMFHELNIPVETRNSRNATWHELSQSNLILLGSPRTNQFLESLQGDYPLLTGTDCIYYRSAKKKRVYKGTRYQDGRLPRMTEYAVVTRRPGLVAGRAVTIIAANHGRAIEGAGHLLTLNDKVQELIGQMHVKPNNELPAGFQMLMQVDTLNVDDEVTAVECIEYFELPAA